MIGDLLKTFSDSFDYQLYRVPYFANPFIRFQFMHRFYTILAPNVSSISSSLRLSKAPLQTEEDIDKILATFQDSTAKSLAISILG